MNEVGFQNYDEEGKASVIDDDDNAQRQEWNRTHLVPIIIGFGCTIFLAALDSVSPIASNDALFWLYPGLCTCFNIWD